MVDRPRLGEKGVECAVKESGSQGENGKGNGPIWPTVLSPGLQ